MMRAVVKIVIVIGNNNSLLGTNQNKQYRKFKFIYIYMVSNSAIKRHELL